MPITRKLKRFLKRLLKRLFRKKRRASARRSAPKLDSGRSVSAPAYRRGASARPRRKRRKGGRIRALFGWLWQRLRKPVMYAGIALALFFAWLWLTLPSIDDLNRVTKTPSIVVRAENGEIIGSYGDVYGEYIAYRDLPKPLIDSLLATEDRNFYHHFGIDPLGLARAIYTNFRAHRLVQGGSTITQQLAKNVFLSPDRTLMRKLREALLAFKLESRFSKNDIITIYLNRVYLGAGTYGVDAAAHRYFGKSARNLTLSESALITGLLKAPSRYAPTGNATLARKRAEQVLINMQDAGYLDDKQLAQGTAELKSLMSRRNEGARSTMYFTDWVVDQIPDLIGNVNADLEVTTTLSPQLQLAAEHAIAGVMDKKGEAMNASQAALVSMQPDGAVRALIGGRSYGESQYNRAVQGKRQPGSAFKLFVYLTALENGMSPDSAVEDRPIRIGKWQPQNYKNGYQGEMSMREALAQSINTVAVSLSERFGRNNVIQMAERLGITSELRPDPSIALGSNELSLMELTTAYAHLAAQGLSVQPYGILLIKTSDGKPLYQRREPSRAAELSQETVGMMDDMLMHVVTDGTGKAARIGRDVAGKTGTTSDYKDAWFIGFTPELATGVWVGNDDATPMKKVTGGSLPASIWHDYMQPALAGTPAHDIPVASRGFTLQGLLPWRHESSAPAATAQRKPIRGNQKGDEDFELGASFWEKLSGSGDVEYRYPKQ